MAKELEREDDEKSDLSASHKSDRSKRSYNSGPKRDKGTIDFEK